ncbi:MAG TPA: protein translocase subunit SecD, partial [Burkholderiaceae bacterium]
MNRYPVWKYALMIAAVLVGLLYTVPNFFGQAPAVQVSAGKTAVKLDSGMVPQVEQILAKASLKADYVTFEGTTLRARFADTDTQIKARDVIDAGLNPDRNSPAYVVALNLLPRSPRWLELVHAAPMHLGLDLRGGVHFLLQVNLDAAIAKKAESTYGDVRSMLREKNLHAGVRREGNNVVLSVRDKDAVTRIENALGDQFGDWGWAAVDGGEEVKITGTLKPASLQKVQDAAIKQNMTTLGNRVAGLGTSEPVIQQQGPDRIVVELPGIQDTAKAKDLIGRTATLEAHLVDVSAEASAALTGGPVPFGDDRFADRNGVPVIVKHDLLFSGDDLTDAQPNFDSQDQQPVVRLSLGSKGAHVLQQASSENIGKPMAIILFDRNKGEAISVATIQSELGANFQIHGHMSPQDAADLALLLRSGALAAPMDFVEESAIGPSLGADNIQKGLHSVAWGFVAIMAFMCLYYMLFGVIST